MSPCEYELIDFGEGRKLERFGKFLLDRPAPAADDAKRANPAAWHGADFKFVQRNARVGSWQSRQPAPQPWEVKFWFGRLRLALSPFGHVGMFPDQIENWKWLSQIGMRPQRLRLLNLFASTGGTTLAAAAQGAVVAHVDAARNIVARARRNAETSGLGQAPVRWITEDAMRFVRREKKRGHRYDGVMLDPPTYGHGPKNENWKIDQHLPELLGHLAELTAAAPRLFVLTCHTPGYDQRRLSDLVLKSFYRAPIDSLFSAPLTIAASDGRRLSSGSVVRWSNEMNEP